MMTATRTIKDEKRVIEFLHMLNNELSNASNYCYKSKDRLSHEVERLIEDGTIILCQEAESIIGVIIWFENKDHLVCDTSIFVAKNRVDYLDIMTLLIKEMTQSLQSEYQLNFFFPRENQRLSTFLEMISAKKSPDEYILRLMKGQEKNLSDWSQIQPVDQETIEQYKQLHVEIFPDAYISSDEVLQDSKHRMVHLLMRKERAVAVSILRIDSSDTATVEFLGVGSSARRQGFGRQMLSHIINKAFNKLGLLELMLVVDSDNPRAIQLYENVGFQLVTQNHSYSLNATKIAFKDV